MSARRPAMSRGLPAWCAGNRLALRVWVGQQPWVCATCARALSPDDTIVFAHGLRQALTLSATSETNHKEEKARLLSYHVLPKHLQVGDRITDETDEWEVASQPYSKIGDKSVRASVRRVDQPATVEDRTWVAHERIRVKSPSQEHRTSAREVFQSEAI